MNVEGVESERTLHDIFSVKKKDRWGVVSHDHLVCDGHLLWQNDGHIIKQERSRHVEYCRRISSMASLAINVVFILGDPLTCCTFLLEFQQQDSLAARAGNSTIDTTGAAVWTCVRAPPGVIMRTSKLHQ